MPPPFNLYLGRRSIVLDSSDSGTWLCHIGQWAWSPYVNRSVLGCGCLASRPETLLKWKGSGHTCHGRFSFSLFVLYYSHGRSDKLTQGLLSWSTSNQLTHFPFFFTWNWVKVRSKPCWNIGRPHSQPALVWRHLV